MTDIKPIPTKYNNILFRSRLEARWAVFFDAAKIRYEYEVEGYENKNGWRYLPDFYLPDFRLHVEVKGDYPEGRNEILKKCEPAIQWGGPIKQILILSTIPGETKDGSHLAFPVLYWRGLFAVWGYGAFWCSPFKDEVYWCLMPSYGSSVRYGGPDGKHFLNDTIAPVSAYTLDDEQYLKEKIKKAICALGYSTWENEGLMTTEEKIKQEKTDYKFLYDCFAKASAAQFEYKENNDV